MSSKEGTAVFSAAVERAAEAMYAAGPWGEPFSFAENGCRLVSDAHDMEVYRDLAGEAISHYLDVLNDR